MQVFIAISSWFLVLSLPCGGQGSWPALSGVEGFLACPACLPEAKAEARVLSSAFPSFAEIQLLRPLQKAIAEQRHPKTDWEYYKKNGHTNPKWDALVQAGFEASESHNLETAANFLERAKGLGCRDGLVLYQLGLHLEIQGLLGEAIKAFRQTEPILRNRYAKHPATKELDEHLGRLLYKTERFGEALSYYLSAIRLQGENFSRLFLVGQMYRIQKQTKEAIAYFEKALAYETKDSAPMNLVMAARMELMKLFFESQAYDKALEQAEQVLAKDPQNPTAISYRDQINLRKSKAEEKKKLKRIIEGY